MGSAVPFFDRECDDEIEAFLKQAKLHYRHATNLAGEVADLLQQNKVIGWFQGRMEFGPRALGAHSILASPLEASMQAHLNLVKDREDFRPVAPVVLEEDAAEWFVDGAVSPFMVFVYDVRPEKADKIPAVRHVDGTARIQTINRSQNRAYYDLLSAFKERTGVPVLINTSFNTGANRWSAVHAMQSSLSTVHRWTCSRSDRSLWRSHDG